MPGSPRFADEIEGTCSAREIERSNQLNERLFEKLGERRDRMFFGDTKKHLLVGSSEGREIPLYVSKFFVISPHTRPEHVHEVVQYLKECITEVCEASGVPAVN